MEGRSKKSKQNDTAGFSASWILFSRMRQCAAVPSILMSRLQKEYFDGTETHGSRMVMAAPVKEFHQKEKSRRPILYHEPRPLENPKNDQVKMEKVFDLSR